MAEMRSQQNQQTAILHQIQQHLVEIQIPPPQEATTDAIASFDPQDAPQIVDTVTATPEDASSPPEASTRLHFTQEVPLSLFSIALDTLRAMLILVRGRVEEGSIVNNARCLGIEFQSQKSGVKYEELAVERSLKL
ncbi:hypothetical protein CK203_101113 [Vitis vinifera]|uniref:Uncharacterized protein n=1 Tax=Vitis vinifera TaxID=29760 RepID=A0A438C549_VITVI|nr:hypothetical protein CK203_101113 [Vitis vinifera]